MTRYYLLGIRDVKDAAHVDMWSVSSVEAALPLVAQTLADKAKADVVLIFDEPPDRDTVARLVQSGPASLAGTPHLVAVAAYPGRYLPVATLRAMLAQGNSPATTEWN